MSPFLPSGAMALRLGLRQIKGLARADAERLVAARGDGYADPRALWRRAGLAPATLERLAHADAFRSMGLDRRRALWAVRGLGPAPLPLFAAAGATERGPEPAARLPEMTLGEHVVEDYGALRLSLKAHPLSFLREQLAREGVTPAARLIDVANGRRVTVAGLVLVRQRPSSARGVIFATLEDETGPANVIVWPDVFERYRRPLLASRLLQVTGPLQREGIVTHVIAERLADRTDLLQTLGPARTAFRADEVGHRTPDPAPSEHAPRRLFRSRDFH
jgi:error-prone DNA polymerase